MQKTQSDVSIDAIASGFRSGIGERAGISTCWENLAACGFRVGFAEMGGIWTCWENLAACGFWVGLGEMVGISTRGGHVRAFIYDYVKTYPEHPAPHDLSASQSKAARSECVVPDVAKCGFQSGFGEMAGISFCLESAIASGFRSGFGEMASISSRGGHVRAFTYDYVKTYLEHPAPHDLSARLISQAQTSSFNFTNFTNFTNLMTIASVLSKTSPAFGSSSFITDATGYATQHLQPAFRSFGAGRYLPFGESWIDQQPGSFDTRYKFSAKELDDETQYSYFGARYYDSDLSVWLSVDAMSDNTPNVSPYAYCINNPVIIVDPDGNDWFVDEATGDVHYNSRLGKNDAAQVGENYKWLGANDMFGYSESDMKSAISDPRGPVSQLAEYTSCDLPYTDGGSQTTYDEAHFKGENAEKFMGAMGYKKVPTQAIEHTTEFQTTTEVGMGRSIDYTSYNVTRILEKYSYVPNSAYEVNTFDISQRESQSTSPYSSQSVSRVSINYSTNSNYRNDRTIRNGVHAVGYGRHSDYLIENYTYASYPGHIKMLNEFIRKH